jgi:hypothetical protein
MGCCEGVTKLCVFTDWDQFLEWMRKYMILMKGFDAQTHIKTYKYFGSSIFTSEIRFPFKNIESRFVLLIEFHSNLCLHYCALLVGIKLTVACLNSQLWKISKISVTGPELVRQKILHLCGTNFYKTYVSTGLPISPEHQSLFPSVWQLVRAVTESTKCLIS